MPFSKYFEDNPTSTQLERNDIQFQVPSLFTTKLAHGGGAEVIPFNQAWQSIPSLTAPSSLGLPIYSASGFDALSVLARVLNRPSPRIVLGPIDMTCSFVVCDLRLKDHPIVYCSPSFCTLTGYSESEVLNRNCRFLQAPPFAGPVRSGELRRFTSQESVDALRESLMRHEEVQTSIVNFRKDGSAFINLVSVIPILGGERGLKGEENDIVYHVGFQVDLTEQPAAILERVRDGRYVVPQAAPSSLKKQRIPTTPQLVLPPAPLQQELVAPLAQRRPHLPPLVMSPTLALMLENPAFHRALPISTSTNAPPPLPSSSSTATPTAPTPTTTTPINSPLSLLILEYTPDPILVVSLKGAFLYAAPSIARLLGHTPSSLVGRAFSDLAHPEDVVPLERQLKESSAIVTLGPGVGSGINTGSVPVPGSAQSPVQAQAQAQAQAARLIDVLFRARTARGVYVWIEARGRLHIEPGKGRKAIILSVRARRMPWLRWGDVLSLPAMACSHTSAHVSSRTGEHDVCATGGEQEVAEKAQAQARREALESSLGSSSGSPPAPAPTTTETLSEFWAQLSGLGPSAGAIVACGEGVASVLGYTPAEVLGRRVPVFVVGEREHGYGHEHGEESVCGGEQTKTDIERILATLSTRTVVFVRMRRKGGGEPVHVRIVFYPTSRPRPRGGECEADEEVQILGEVHAQTHAQGETEEETEEGEREEGLSVAPPVVLMHVCLSAHAHAHTHTYDPQLESPAPSTATITTLPSPLLAHPTPYANVFEELETRRGSSWQYELQQMRFLNAKLREEVERLERLEAAEAVGVGAGAGAGMGAGIAMGVYGAGAGTGAGAGSDVFDSEAGALTGVEGAYVPGLGAHENGIVGNPYPPAQSNPHSHPHHQQHSHSQYLPTVLASTGLATLLPNMSTSTETHPYAYPSASASIHTPLPRPQSNTHSHPQSQSQSQSHYSPSSLSISGEPFDASSTPSTGSNSNTDTALDATATANAHETANTNANANFKAALERYELVTGRRGRGLGSGRGSSGGSISGGGVAAAATSIDSDGGFPELNDVDLDLDLDLGLGLAMGMGMGSEMGYGSVGMVAGAGAATGAVGGDVDLGMEEAQERIHAPQPVSIQGGLVGVGAGAEGGVGLMHALSGNGVPPTPHQQQQRHGGFGRQHHHHQQQQQQNGHMHMPAQQQEPQTEMYCRAEAHSHSQSRERHGQGHAHAHANANAPQRYQAYDVYDHPHTHHQQQYENGLEPLSLHRLPTPSQHQLHVQRHGQGQGQGYGGYEAHQHLHLHLHRLGGHQSYASLYDYGGGGDYDAPLHSPSPSGSGSGSNLSSDSHVHPHTHTQQYAQQRQLPRSASASARLRGAGEGWDELWGAMHPGVKRRFEKR